MSVTASNAPSADESATPRHVAIIMDGNGRWAKKRFLPRALGHREGAEAVRRTVRAASELGIDYLTLYAFSSENWKRPADEIDDLMGLLRLYLRNEVRELNNSHVRIRFIGARDRLSDDVLKLIDDSEKLTAANTGLTLVIALNYGAQAEIVSAVQIIAGQVARGEISTDQIDEALIARHLFTVDIPDPDLIIRTSGEQRLSNFLLWQAAYAELIFIETLWPDFDRAALEHAITDYHNRDRRYGGRPA
jgi:undecaprenyl diphosphate synthase